MRATNGWGRDGSTVQRPLTPLHASVSCDFQVKKAEVRKMISDLDKDEAGLISFDDFVDVMTGRMVR